MALRARTSRSIAPGLVTVCCLLLTAFLSSPVQAVDGGRAGLVVQFADGSVWTACIPFEGESISGDQLLQRSGLNLVLDYGYGLGGAVCKIGADGCNFPLEDCFCQCQGVDCRYWAYYHLQPDDTWQYSPVGSSSYGVQDGDVEGWAWGPGDYGISGQQPPVHTFAELCPLPTDTPTPTSLPDTSTPTSTPPPAATPTATATPWPTVTPTPIPPTPSMTPTGTSLSLVFAAEAPTIARGECTMLSWDVVGAQAIYWNDGQGERGVVGRDARQVCPAVSQTYMLRVLHSGGEELRRVDIVVTEPVVLAPTPSSATRATPPPTLPPPTPTALGPDLATPPLAVDAAQPMAVAMSLSEPESVPDEGLAAPDGRPPAQHNAESAAQSSNTLREGPTATSAPHPAAAPADTPRPASPTPQKQALALALPQPGSDRSSRQANTAPGPAMVQTGLALQPTQLLSYSVFAFLAAILCGAGLVVLWRRG